MDLILQELRPESLVADVDRLLADEALQQRIVRQLGLATDTHTHVDLCV